MQGVGPNCLAEARIRCEYTWLQLVAGEKTGKAIGDCARIHILQDVSCLRHHQFFGLREPFGTCQ